MRRIFLFTVVTVSLAFGQTQGATLKETFAMDA
jgi:hypothetical protein